MRARTDAEAAPLVGPAPAVRALSDHELLSVLMCERYAMVKPCTRPGARWRQWCEPASSPVAGPERVAVEEARAARLCAGCPVLEVCLELALREPIEGVQGGTTERGRAWLRARRKDEDEDLAGDGSRAVAS